MAEELRNNFCLNLAIYCVGGILHKAVHGGVQGGKGRGGGGGGGWLLTF